MFDNLFEAIGKTNRYENALAVLSGAGALVFVFYIVGEITHLGPGYVVVPYVAAISALAVLILKNGVKMHRDGRVLVLISLILALLSFSFII
jgi:hypothetical protein